MENIKKKKDLLSPPKEWKTHKENKEFLARERKRRKEMQEGKNKKMQEGKDSMGRGWGNLNFGAEVLTIKYSFCP